MSGPSTHRCWQVTSRERSWNSSAKSYLVYNRVDSLEETGRKIEKVSAAEILDIANEIFERRQLSSLTYL